MLGWLEHGAPCVSNTYVVRLPAPGHAVSGEPAYPRRLVQVEQSSNTSVVPELDLLNPTARAVGVFLASPSHLPFTSPHTVLSHFEHIKATAYPYTQYKYVATTLR